MKSIINKSQLLAARLQTRRLPFRLCAAMPFLVALPPIQAQVTQINPIVVTGNSSDQPLSEVMPSVSVISRADIARLNPPDMMSILQGEPGLDVFRNGSIGSPISVFMRGSASSQFLLLVDGVKMGDEGTGISGIENIPMSQIDHIEILRGNASALYGSKASGGVIQVFTRGGQGLTGPSAEVSYGSRNSMSTSAGYGVSADGWKTSIFLSHQQGDGYSSVNLNQYPGTNAEKNNYQADSLQANIAKQLTPGHEVGAKIFYIQNNYQYNNPVSVNFGGPDTGLYSVENRTQTLLGYSQNEITNYWLSKFSIANSKMSSTTNYLAKDNDFALNYYGVSPFQNPYLKGQTEQNDYLWKNEFHLGQTQQVIAGVELNTIQYNYQSLYDTSIGDRKLFSIFSGYTAKYDRIGVQVNVRRDELSNQDQKQSANTGLLGVSYDLSSTWKWTSSVSNAFNAPTVYQLYSSNYGNPHLKPERANSIEMGLQYLVDETLFKVVAFQTKYQELITTDPNNNYQYMNVNQASSKGVEASLKSKWMGNYLQLGLTLQNPTNDDDGTQLIGRSKNFGSIDISRKIEHWTVGSQWIAVSSRTYPDDAGNQITSGGYALMNLYGGYQFDKNWSARLRIDNLLNRDYQNAYGYNTPKFGAFLTLRYLPS
ncbi:TonB-dependent receptor plug domain-containing protein [Polynucleobacter kasalickyi]|uniref:Vitamin B12 transporter n=1 Tax=Polynucleobacter kasalickyi TaxID=1938817 RepID=A0A1W1ZP91_9BURK|nr:TonB-dependent receptor [Polynucleobacter kasalickyi]SMC50239.1 vitamin B12 transporter [Polynucleobacter kasalickyi]